MKSFIKFTKCYVKRQAQQISAKFGLHTLPLCNPSLLVLMYHRVLPSSDSRTITEEPGMIVTPDTLKMHLSLVKEYFQPVRLSDWITCKELNNPLPKRACAITFDDGWADNYEYAYPILLEEKIPATIYLTSGMIGTNKLFWPERLAHILKKISNDEINILPEDIQSWLNELHNGFNKLKKSPSAEDLADIIHNAKSMPDSDIHLMLNKVCKQLHINESNYQSQILNWQQVKEMQDSGLVDFGSHTCSHIRLTDQVQREILELEIQKSKLDIETHTKASVTSFCYPNGDFSQQSMAIVKRFYKSAVTTNYGWNTLFTDNYQLKRIAIHNDRTHDRTSFLSRISGWM